MWVRNLFIPTWWIHSIINLNIWTKFWVGPPLLCGITTQLAQQAVLGNDHHPRGSLFSCFGFANWLAFLRHCPLAALHFKMCSLCCICWTLPCLSYKFNWTELEDTIIGVKGQEQSGPGSCVLVQIYLCLRWNHVSRFQHKLWLQGNDSCPMTTGWLSQPGIAPIL